MFGQHVTFLCPWSKHFASFLGDIGAKGRPWQRRTCTQTECVLARAANHFHWRLSATVPMDTLTLIHYFLAKHFRSHLICLLSTRLLHGTRMPLARPTTMQHDMECFLPQRCTNYSGKEETRRKNVLHMAPALAGVYFGRVIALFVEMFICNLARVEKEVRNVEPISWPLNSSVASSKIFHSVLFCAPPPQKLTLNVMPNTFVYQSTNRDKK